MRTVADRPVEDGGDPGRGDQAGIGPEGDADRIGRAGDATDELGERVVGCDLERLAADGQPELGFPGELSQLGLDLLGRLAGNRAALAR